MDWLSATWLITMVIQCEKWTNLFSHISFYFTTSLLSDFYLKKPVLQVTLQKCLAFFDWLMYFQKWKLWFMDFFPEQRFQQIPKSWKRVQNIPSNSRRNVLPIFQKLRREGLGLHWLNCTTQQTLRRHYYMKARFWKWYHW